MVALTISGVCEIVPVLVDARAGEAGRGPLLLVQTDDTKRLRPLALAIGRQAVDERPRPIYYTDGSVRGEHGWPFLRLRKGSRIRLQEDGELVAERSGLIFPQDRPIVLLVASFDLLEPTDQLAYAHLVDGEGGDLALHTGSVLIADVSTDAFKVLPEVRNRGFFVELGD